MLEKDILSGETLAFTAFLIANLGVSNGQLMNPQGSLTVAHLLEYKSFPECNSKLEAHYFFVTGLRPHLILTVFQIQTNVTVSASPSLVDISQELIALHLQSLITVSIYWHFLNTMKRTPPGAFI